MWRRCFPNAKVVGLDISPRGPTNTDDLVALVEVDFVEGNQTDSKLLTSLGSFDVVIDDGGHGMDEQITSFQTLFPAMNSGGWYFIEDLHTSYWSIVKPTTITFLKGLVDDLHASFADKEKVWPVEELRFVDSLVAIRHS